MKKPELVIMAAGMGRRYGGMKQIDPIDGEGHIIIDFSIYDAIRAGFQDITFIIKKEIEKDFRDVMDPHLAGKNVNVKYVFQELDKLPKGYAVPDCRVKPWGTGHALLCCLGTVDAPFAVINADDYYGAHAFEKIYAFLKNSADDKKAHFAMVGYRVGNTVTEKGTVARGVCSLDEQGCLTEVVERTQIGTENGEIYYIEDEKRHPLAPDTLVSMNLWGFTPAYLRECEKRFPRFLDENLKTKPETCEFYLPSVVSEMIEEGLCDVHVLENEDRWHGVTYREDKADVVAAFADLKAEGVYPEKF